MKRSKNTNIYQSRGIQTLTPTRSETSDEDNQEDDDIESAQFSEGDDDDSEFNFGVPIPNHYGLSPSSSSHHQSPRTSPREMSNNDGDIQRLVTMAKRQNSHRFDTPVTNNTTIFRRGQQQKGERDKQIDSTIAALDPDWSSSRNQPPQSHSNHCVKNHHGPQERRHRVTFRNAFPVDTDTGEAFDSYQYHNKSEFDRAWESPPPEPNDREEEEEETSSASKFPFLSHIWYRIFGYPQVSYDCNASKEEGLASISSEKTPKISNVDPKSRAKRLRQVLGQYTFGDRLEAGWKRLIGTRNGRIVLALCSILMLAAMVTIIAATARSSKQSKAADQAVGMNEGSTTLMIPENPIEPRLGTTSPTTDDDSSATTSAPTSQSTTFSPSSSSTYYNTTMSPTVSPMPNTTLSPTMLSIQTSTLSPTKYPTEGPTKSPTEGPTRSPTITPTSTPTSAENSTRTFSPSFFSVSVVTPPPIATEPPSSSPTSSPTGSPTSGFLKETFQEVGQVLTGSAPNQRFGNSVALSEDGKIMAVGAPFANVGRKIQAGIVQVYELTKGEWGPRGPALEGRNSGDQFGASVAISQDGSILVASEPNFNGASGQSSGNVRVFVYGPFDQYELIGQEIEGESASDQFGNSVALSGDGRRLAIGAPYHGNGVDAGMVSGQVKVYGFTNGTWALEGNPLTGANDMDWFGWNVDLSTDGGVLAVGAPRNLDSGGYVKCYQFSKDDWVPMGDAILNQEKPRRYDDSFGHSLKLDGNNRIAIGAPGTDSDSIMDSGIVGVYEYDDSNRRWDLLGKMVKSTDPGVGDQMGFSVHLRNDILVVGLPGRQNQGQVDMYQYLKGQWDLYPFPLQGVEGSNFGYSVSLTSALAVGSAEAWDRNSGMVNVYSQSPLE